MEGKEQCLRDRTHKTFVDELVARARYHRKLSDRAVARSSDGDSPSSPKMCQESVHTQGIPHFQGMTRQFSDRFAFPGPRAEKVG